jgi:hypothetical protein
VAISFAVSVKPSCQVNIFLLFWLKLLKTDLLLFPGRCWLAYRAHGSFLGAVRCPVCRQQVNIVTQMLPDGMQLSYRCLFISGYDPLSRF